MVRPGDLLNDASVLSLRSFVAVVETQSFSSAARQLRLAPSSVTKHVQGLEQGLNLALLHRTTRRLRLTEAGERFYEHCQAILAQIDAMAGGGGTGTDRASARDRAALLRDDHVRAQSASFYACPSRHRRGSAGQQRGTGSGARPPDMAIQLAEAPDTKLTHLLLAPAPRVLCAAPSYLKRHGRPRVPVDLLSHVCLSSRFSELAESWMLQHGGQTHAIALESRLLCDNGDVLRHACLKGSGIGNLYRFHIRADLRAGRLEPVLPDYPPSPRNIYAVTPHRQLLRPQARAFIDFTRDVLERQGAAHA